MEHVRVQISSKSHQNSGGSPEQPHLTFHTQEDRVNALKNFVNDLFPDACLEESFADRLVYSVPQHAVSSLAQCFYSLEKGEKTVKNR